MTEKLSQYELSTNSMFYDMCTVMKLKFLKYFRELPLVFTCGAALNPTINVGGVGVLMGKNASNLGLSEFEAHFVENENFKFNDTFQKLFHHYVTKYGQPTNLVVDHIRRGLSSRHDRDANIGLYNT